MLKIVRPMRSLPATFNSFTFPSRSNYLILLMWLWLFCIGCEAQAPEGASEKTIVQPNDRDEIAIHQESSRQTTPRKNLARYEATHRAMGVQIRIALYANDSQVANKAMAASFDRIDQLENIFSDYKSSSEIRKLCESAPHSQWQSASNELLHLVSVSKTIHAQTGGAFDISIGRVSRLWRGARLKKKLPNAQQLANVLKTTGIDNIQLNSKKQIKITTANMRVDFGGIAKGYTGDEVLKTLKEIGISSALVDMSGDVVVSNPPPGKSAWTIEVAGLQKDEKPNLVLLKNQAIATSGDAYQYLEIDGVRYSHILDPETGVGIQGRRSVSVIASSGAEADAYASAFTVLGTKTSLKKLRQFPGVHFQIFEIDANDTPLKTASAGFSKFVVDKLDK